MTNEQLARIASDPLVLHGQATVTGTRVTVSVVLDCLAAGMSEAEILAEYPFPNRRGNPGGCCLRRRTSPGRARSARPAGVKVNLDEKLPASLGEVLVTHDHPVDTVIGEDLVGHPDVDLTFGHGPLG